MVIQKKKLFAKERIKLEMQSSFERFRYDKFLLRWPQLNFNTLLEQAFFTLTQNVFYKRDNMSK